MPKRKRNLLFSRSLEDAINSTLKEKGKVLLFLNRKGFATFAFCHTCGFVQKCPRCDVNLVYHFNPALLKCHRCSFKIQPPEICPHCHAGYIKYSGAGTEKIESELSRLFPQARTKRIEDPDDSDLKGVDIAVSASAVVKQTELQFDLVAVLGIDSALNRVDWRASEKTFALLMGLSGLTEKKMLIQTASPEHICFQALLKKDPQHFYEEELRQRKQLNYPPYRHMVFVKVRSKKAERAESFGPALFKRLVEKNAHKDIRIVSVNPGQPPQLRGNFYQQILVLAGDPRKVGVLLRLCLKDLAHSGIIVTADVDPV